MAANTTKKIRVGVLCGGQSSEHSISCLSGASLLSAIDREKFEPVPIGITQAGQWVSLEGLTQELAIVDGKLPVIPVHAPAVSVNRDGVFVGGVNLQIDVMFPVLHGPYGEDGTVQGLLELLDVPYVGAGVLASAVGMDKAMSKDVLARHGIAQPRYVAVRDSDVSTSRLEQIAAELHYPIFVKPANMGSSVGVSKAHDFDELVAATDIAMTYDEWIVFEEAIVGREIEVAVLGSHHPQASVAGEIVPGHEFYDYEDKYLSDGAQLMIPAPLTAAQSDTVRQLAIEVFQALRGEGLARVDFFFEENGRGFLCNEVNTMPGFTPISMYPKLWMATGVSYSDLIDRLVELARERHSRRRRNTGH